MDSHTFVHVVSKWPALRLSNQCSFTRVSNSYTYREVMFFFFQIKLVIKKKKEKVEFSFPYFCSLLKGVSVR